MNHKLPLLLTSLMLAGGALQLRADEVKLTTALASGEKLAIALNADLTATLNWGDGSQQTIESDGSLQEIDVKSSTLTITTTDALTSLYVQGNKLSALDVSGAPSLLNLYCADNQLQELDLTKNTTLTTLDAQDNQLGTLTASALKALTDVNVANNGMTKLTLASTARLNSLVCSGNQLTALPSAAILSTAETVWAQDNSVTSLPIAQAKNLRSLCADNNQVSTVNFTTTNQLAEVSLDNNKLTTLDISKGASKLQYLSAANNQLTTITWNKECKRTCKYVYLPNNALFLNSMPSLVFGGQAVNVDLSGQKDYSLPKYVYEVGEQVDIYSLVAQNGWGISTNAKVSVVQEDGTPLTAGTDYTVSSHRYTFKDVYKRLAFNVTSSSYSGYTFRTAVFNVGTTEAINQATASQALTFSTRHGQLAVHAAQPVHLSVCSAAGVTVVNTQIAAGENTFALPAGIYVVNGQKVLVP